MAYLGDSWLQEIFIFFSGYFIKINSKINKKSSIEQIIPVFLSLEIAMK